MTKKNLENNMQTLDLLIMGDDKIEFDEKEFDLFFRLAYEMKKNN